MICIYCKKEIIKESKDHFIPQCIGGKDKIICCEICNNKLLGSKIEGRIRRNIQLSMAIDSTTLKERYWELNTNQGLMNRKIGITDSKKMSLLNLTNEVKTVHLK
jgi:hypothetical protein